MLNVPAINRNENVDNWLTRVAEANGFKGVKEFYNSITEHSGVIPKQLRYNKIFEVLGVTNWARMILEHTIYPYLVLFCGNWITTSYLDYVFNNSDAYRLVIPRGLNVELDNKEDSKYLEQLINHIENIDCQSLLATLNITTKTNKKEIIHKIREIYPTVEKFPKSENIVISREEYEVLYESYNLCELVHKKCGTHFCMSKIGLQYGLDCPTCRPKGQKQLERTINSIDGYKFLEQLPKGYIKVQHEDCGKIYTTTTASLINGKRCNCELWTLKRLQDYFQEHKGFELVSYKDGMATIKHLDCGNTFTVRFDHFQESPYCRSCTPIRIRSTHHTVFEQIRAMNLEFVGTIDHKHITARCHYGHEFTRTLKALRENNTCPYCNREERYKGTKEGQYINYLHKHYRSNNIIFLEDEKEHENEIQSLVKKDFLTVVAHGAYSLGYPFTDEDIVLQRYVKRRNKVIGYTSGETFAYEIGLLQEEPKRLCVSTTLYKGSTSRTFNTSELTYKVKPALPKMTQKNWKEVQVADFIPSSCFYEHNQTRVLNKLTIHIKNNGLKVELINKLLTKRNTYTNKIMKLLTTELKKEGDKP